jgi:hypothetical protein
LSETSDVKISPLQWFFCATFAALLTGCANYQASGAAPGSDSGTAKSESRAERSKQAREGEFYKTETITPGVGSALFPDPAWR